ncbi:MAG: hypothetical protein HXX14_09215 [Bacteroidetes bacterium]|nr:hypothetical protein [Bacteroidota bacterium]
MNFLNHSKLPPPRTEINDYVGDIRRQTTTNRDTDVQPSIDTGKTAPSLPSHPYLQYRFSIASPYLIRFLYTCQVPVSSQYAIYPLRFRGEIWGNYGAKKQLYSAKKGT